MAKKKSRSSVPIGGPFTPILFEVQDSQAYQSLSGNSAKLYGYLVRTARTICCKTGNTDTIKSTFDYTYSEAKGKGFANATFKRSMTELWQKGFISVVSVGGMVASEGNGKIPSRYQLCNFWKSYGKQWNDRTKLERDPWGAYSEPVESEKEW